MGDAVASFNFHHMLAATEYGMRGWLDVEAETKPGETLEIGQEVGR